MADIFLSHERTDRQRIAPIVALLESRGWSVRWEPPADAGDRATERELAAAGCVIVAWSIDSVDSAAVRAEASHGLARDILISVSIDFSRPPPELEQASSLAFAGWTGDASSPRAQELLGAVGRLLAGAPAHPAAAADVKEPPARAQPDEVEADPEPEAEPGPGPDEAGPDLDLEEEAAELVSAFQDQPEDDEQDRLSLPPALLRREAVPHPVSPDVPRSLPARRSLAAGLVASVAIVAAAAAFWTTEWPAASKLTVEEVAVKAAPEPAPKVVAPTAAPPKSHEAKPHEAKSPEAKPAETRSAAIKPSEVEATPKALPKVLGIEALLGQTTPRVEELLAVASRLIRIGDIHGAREVLAAPETAHSGVLTFLLAETYDPNVLPAPLKGSMADPERARALYRKARELGDGRAEDRLDGLKASG